MLEQETERILDILTERTIMRRDAITLREVMSADVPKGVKVYLRTDVMQLLRADLAAAPRFGRINRSSPGVEQLTTAFLRSLSDAYQFSRTDYISLLDDAVHFVLSYLYRPQWTLEQFVFDRAKSLTIDEMLSKLDYTFDYAYFKRLIEKVVRQWGWKEIGVKDFRVLLSKIDNQVVKQHSARELAMLPKPLYDFLTLSDASLYRAAPLDPLLHFFDDKGMKGLRDYLETVCRGRSRSELTLTELIDQIEEFYARGAQPAEPASTTPVVSTGESARLSHAELTSVDADIAAGVKEAERPPSPLEEPVPADPMSLIAGAAAAASPPQLPDIASLIPSKHRARFIRKLFRKDEHYYTAVLAELNKTTTWQAASGYLKDFYTLNKLDPFDDLVVAFTDVVHARFGSGSQG